MFKRTILLALFMIVAFSLSTFAQEVSVVLKNSKVITGRIVEENPEYLVLSSDVGEVKVVRQNIETINYNPFVKMKSSLKEETAAKLMDEGSPDGHKFILNDRVVVHLANGNVVSGLLLAKSLNMIMIQTEVGNLTIPKKDLALLEYVSSEYAERGEVVIVNLSNGTHFEGNIYFEDTDNLTLDTQLGRLTIDKNKLRSIEYTGKTGLGEIALVDQYAQVTINRRSILDRYDVFEIGYSPDFGIEYGPGYGLGYESRFSLAQFEGFNLSAIGKLGLTYFGLNEDTFSEETVGQQLNVKGGSLVTTFGGGAQLNIYPQTSSFFDFYIAPTLEGHLVYRSLERDFPSAPSLNSEVTETEFKFGVGTKFGLEFLFDSFRVGVGYNYHFIFGGDSFSQVSLSFVKKLF